MSFVYILKSLKTGKYYIGVSDNPIRRLNEHNQGKVRSTKYSKPWKLVFSQKYPSKRVAFKVEYRLKKLRRRDYLEKIIEEGKIRIEAVDR